MVLVILLDHVHYTSLLVKIRMFLLNIFAFLYFLKIILLREGDQILQLLGFSDINRTGCVATVLISSQCLRDHSCTEQRDI